MGQLPWLKLYTETIDDPKIKRLSVRERWIWVTVLCLAQKSPVNGKLMLTSTQKLDHSDIATAAMLTINDFTEEDKKNGNFEAWTQFGHEEFMVESAIQKFESLEMIKRDKNGVVTLCNFLKRQFGKASNAPDEIRKRVESFRKRKKSEHETPSCNADVTRCNAIDKDIDRDKDKEEEEDKKREESLRGEKKNEKTAPNVAQAPLKELLKTYHSICTDLPKVLQLTHTRKIHAAARLKEHPEIEFWQGYFRRVARSDFLCGRAPPKSDGRPFKADFEWLIKQANFVKVCEGRYDNREIQKQKTWLEKQQEKEQSERVASNE